MDADPDDPNLPDESRARLKAFLADCEKTERELQRLSEIRAAYEVTLKLVSSPDDAEHRATAPPT